MDLVEGAEALGIDMDDLKVEKKNKIIETVKDSYEISPNIQIENLSIETTTEKLDMFDNSQLNSKIVKINTNQEENPAIGYNDSFFHQTFSNADEPIQVHQVRNNTRDIKQNYSCQICPKVFTNLARLETHSLIHKKLEKFKTLEKSQIDTTRENNHIVEQTQGLFQKTVSDGDEPVQAYIEKKEAKLNFSCQQCPKVFTDLEKFKRHGLIHKKLEKLEMFENPQIEIKTKKMDSTIEENLFVEFKEDLSQPRFSNYDEAMSADTEKRDVKQNYSCQLCPKVFTDLDRLERHALIHKKLESLKKEIKVETVLFSCTTCKKQFKSENNLKAHMSTHLDVKAFQCPLCDQKFRQRSDMSSHVVSTHTQYKDQPNNCSICDARLSSFDALKSHMASMHAELLGGGLVMT